MLQPSLCPERGARCRHIVYRSAFAFAFAVTLVFASVFVVGFFSFSLSYSLPLPLSLPLSFYYTKVKAVFYSMLKNIFFGTGRLLPNDSMTFFCQNSSSE